ncbi:hypothetical protein BV25DRAFT_1800242, partial [Artomyces pyxidatus]
IGINVTSCNNVVLMEPWWNPYVEDQAIGRAHRLGQKRPVHVYKLVVKNTIEDQLIVTVSVSLAPILSCSAKTEV